MGDMLRYFGFLLMVATAMTLGACGGGGGGDDGNATPKSAQVQVDDGSANEESAYEVILLGDLGKDNQAIALNDAGTVIGHYQDNAGVQHAFLWSGGTMRHLVESARVTAINSSGEIVGWLEEGNTTEAFFYADRIYHFDLPEGASRAYAVDFRGRVVGRISSGGETAFYDDDMQTRMLVPEVEGYATGINDSGQILIKKLQAEGIRSLLLESNGTMTDLGSFGGPNTQSEDLNASGQIVGWSQSADGRYRAFLWENGEMIDLSQPGWTFSSAVAINDSGQILIKASDGTANRAYLWEAGQITDLEHFGLEYAEVTDMNNGGQVVGWTMDQSADFRAFLASPRN